MRSCGKSYYWLLCSVAFSVVAAARADDQPRSRSDLARVGDTPVAHVVHQLGAKLERGTSTKELDEYSVHFDRMDPNRDGKHTREEYIEKGRYMTPQTRAGIFRAADSNADGVVTKAEYVLNRIITDEGKAIVQGMDDDENGLVQRAEFIKHSTKLLSDRQLAEQVFAALDVNADGGIPIPEYLQVWGRWARVGRKSAEERIAARRAELAKSVNKPVEGLAPSVARRPGSGPPPSRPGAVTGPPSVDEVFERFDSNKDGMLQKDEVPEFARQFILPADTDGDDAVTKKELQASRPGQRPGGDSRPAADAPRQGWPDRTAAEGRGGFSLFGEVQQAPETCPACAMGLTAEFVFNRLDVNEDRLVTVTEFRRSPGMDDEVKARDVVRRLDKTGDGKLSWEELKSAFDARHANCKKPDPATLAANAEQVRPDGRGDGSRFARVFILRSDSDEDGKISQEEFRGPASGFNRLDQNKNGFIEADELGDLHQRRLNDPKSMRERLQSGDVPNPQQNKRTNGLGDVDAKKN